MYGNKQEKIDCPDLDLNHELIYYRFLKSKININFKKIKTDIKVLNWNYLKKIVTKLK